MNFKVTPELYSLDIKTSKAFFVEVLGFSVKYERSKEQFVYLTLDGVDLMLEDIGGDSRKWVTGNLEPPLGRGINFQWDVVDIDALYQRVVARAPEAIYLVLESKTYQCGSSLVPQKQFIVQTPDGYLFRFCQEYKKNHGSRDY